MYALLNDAARPGPEFPRPPETPSALWRRWIREGWFDWEPDGWPYWSHHHHVATWWPHRELPNVLLVHYSDLLADLDTEMRRVATFLDIEVDDQVWPELVAAARFDAMKDEARRLDAADPAGGSRMLGHDGADTFFYRGTNGRWRSALTEDDLALYDDAATALDRAPGLAGERPPRRALGAARGYSAASSWGESTGPDRDRAIEEVNAWAKGVEEHQRSDS